MNTKAKGSRREREVRDIFRKEGYHVIKAGASLGVMDLICVWKDFSKHPIGIQVKSTRISKAERTEIEVLEIGIIKEIWIKKDRKPWIRDIWNTELKQWERNEV